MSHAGPPTGARISVLALCSMAHPVFSVSPLLVHPRSAQNLPWRRARGRQKTPSEKNTDAVSSLLAAYPPLANVTAEADMLRTGGGLCATGLARRGVCCAATCATCGGRGCGRPANASGVCCKSSIVAERRPPHARAQARDGRFAQVRSRRRCEQPGDVACVLPEARAEIVDDDVDDGIFAPPNASSSPSLSNNYFVVVSTQHAGARWIAAELAARQCVTAGGEFFAARDAFHWTARAQRRALAALFSGAGAVDEASPKFAQWVEAVADPRRRHFYTRGGDSAPPRRRSTVVATDKHARSASGGCSRNASPRRSTRGSRGLPPRAASGSSSWGARTSCASPSPSATRAAASVAWMAASGGAPAQRRAQANGSRPVTLPTGRRLLDLLREERRRAARHLN